MVPFIVTLLVLSTLNVDAQIGVATFKDEDDLPFGVMSFEPAGDGEYVDVSMVWDVIENSKVANDSSSFRMFIMMSEDCTGFPYSVDNWNLECRGGELDCFSEDELFSAENVDLGLTVSFKIPHIPIEDLLSYSLSIVQGSTDRYCAVINQYLTAETLDDESDGFGFSLLLTSGPLDGIVQVLATWSPVLTIDRIEIHENPVIDGDCSTTGDIFTNGYRPGCEYGSISCELPKQANFESDDGEMSGELTHLMFDHLFCHAERSVVVILKGETEPHSCYNFDLTSGAVAGCPSQSPSATRSATRSATSSATRSATISVSSSASMPVVEEDDESSAFARGPYQGFFFAVVFCLCAFYFQ